MTKRGRMNEEPYAGMWDFDSSTAPLPGRETHHDGQRTFSLGVFQWLPTARGKGLKPGKVMFRMKGFCTIEGVDQAHRRAREFCEKKQRQDTATVVYTEHNGEDGA